MPYAARAAAGKDRPAQREDAEAMDADAIKTAKKSLPMMWKISRIGKALDTLPDIAEPGETMQVVVPTQTWSDDHDAVETAFMLVGTDRRLIVLRAGLRGAKDVIAVGYDEVQITPDAKKADKISLVVGDLSLRLSGPKDRIAALLELTATAG
jgi:hypothetical protein